MRFYTILSIALLHTTPIMAHPVHPVDLNTMVTAVNAVSESLNAFTRTVKALTASTNLTQFAADLTAKSTGIFASLKSGASSINETSEITMSEALQLTIASDQLAEACVAVVNGLISKKAILDKAGYSATLATQMNREVAAVKEFNEIMTSKVPDDAKDIVREQGRDALAALAVSSQVLSSLSNGQARPAWAMANYCFLWRSAVSRLSAAQGKWEGASPCNYGPWLRRRRSRVLGLGYGGRVRLRR
jgi:hypothetical protein